VCVCVCECVYACEYVRVSESVCVRERVCESRLLNLAYALASFPDLFAGFVCIHVCVRMCVRV